MLAISTVPFDTPSSTPNAGISSRRREGGDHELAAAHVADQLPWRTRPQTPGWRVQRLQEARRDPPADARLRIDNRRRRTQRGEAPAKKPVFWMNERRSMELLRRRGSGAAADSQDTRSSGHDRDLPASHGIHRRAPASLRGGRHAARQGAGDLQRRHRADRPTSHSAGVAPTASMPWNISRGCRRS